MDQVSRLPSPEPQRRWVPVERTYAPALARLADRRPAEAPPDFFEILRKLWRHRMIVLVSTLSCTVLAAAVVSALPKRYMAEAKVLVGVPEVRVMNVESIIANLTPNADRVQNETFVMQSRELAQQVIERLRLAENPEFNWELRREPAWRRYLRVGTYIPDAWAFWRNDPPPPMPSSEAALERRDHLIDALLSQVNVTSLGRSHVLSVEAESQNPKTAAAIANTLAEAYLRQQQKEKLDVTDQAEKFLAGRIAELRQQVEKSDQAVEEYRKKNNLYRGTSAGVTSQQLTELNSQLIIAQTAKAEAESRLREAQTVKGASASSDATPEVLRSPLIAALKQAQAEAERKMADLSASYGEQHPRMANLRAEINDTRKKIRIEIDRTIQSLRQEAGSANARYGALKANFDQAQKQMGTVNEQSIPLDALERDAAVNRKLLENMLSRAKETTGQEALQQPDAKLISTAAPSTRPSFPPRSLIVFLGGVGGFLIGMLIALLREGSDRTFRLGEQVETATGLPVLAMVPNLRGHAAPTAHVLRMPVSPYSEALRKVYIGLQLSESDHSPKTVMFASATPAEGKSVLIASLGRMLASNGRRVLLIDCDWRRPSLHRYFNRENRGGLASLLTGEDVALDRVIHNDALSGADVIVAGDLRPQASHLLTSDRMQALLRTFAKNYDLVMLDTPPVLVGAEVLTLSRMVEKVIFAIRWGKIRRETALEALKQLLDARADVAGVVLSRVDAERYRQYAYGHLNYQYVRPSFSFFR